MVGYVDASYMSDLHNARSQTGFVFLCGGAAISWRSVKETLVATWTNHSEIIALYEAAWECVWLRRMINHIQKSCGLNVADTPTIIYEDNAACVAQMHMGYVKSNLMKHIAPKFFYPHELQKSEEIKSCKQDRAITSQIFSQNLYLLLASINASTELVWGGLENCRVRGRPAPKTQSMTVVLKITSWFWRPTWTSTVVLFFPWWVFPTGFSHARFLTRQQVQHKRCVWCTFFSYPFFSLDFWGEFLTRHTHSINLAKGECWKSKSWNSVWTKTLNSGQIEWRRKIFKEFKHCRFSVCIHHILLWIGSHFHLWKAIKKEQASSSSISLSLSVLCMCCESDYEHSSDSIFNKFHLRNIKIIVRLYVLGSISSINYQSVFWSLNFYFNSTLSKKRKHYILDIILSMNYQKHIDSTSPIV